MRTLPIVWQRLVDERGETCPRCDATGAALRKAVEELRAALEPFGLKPTLEIVALDEAEFRQDPRESNRIWIAGRPLEEWIGAATGASPCCSACGDADCRTVKVGATEFEAVPAELVVKAALVAAES